METEMTMDDVTITYPGIISHKSLSFHPTPASITQDVEDRCRKRYEFFQNFSIFFFFFGFWLGVPLNIHLLGYFCKQNSYLQ